MANQNDNRLRGSIPITGLDTATPDISVQDGKCAELHNLRWAASGWRDVKPLETKVDFNDTADTLPISLKIVYHHPAAGDDVYIASIAGSGDTINLCQVQCVDGEIKIIGSSLANTNPLYIGFRRGMDATNTYLSLRSFYPVTSDVSVLVSLNSHSDTVVITRTLTIKTGGTKSEECKNYRLVTHSIQYKPIPSSDSTYSYPFFQSRDYALANGNIFALNLPANIKLRHFGNILFILDSEAKQITYYSYANNGYCPFILPAPPFITQSVERGNAECKLNYVLNSDQTNSYFYRFPLYNVGTNTYFPSQFTDKKGSWHGEICCFVAYKMVDGSVVSPSGLLLFASELDNNTEECRAYQVTDLFGTRTQYREFCSIEYRDGFGDRFDQEWYVKFKSFAHSGVPDPHETSSPYGTLNISIRPTINIATPNDIDAKMIASIVVYSTRINPIYDTEKMASHARLAVGSSTREEGRHAYGGAHFFADNKLPEQPFYRVKEIDIRDIQNNNYSLELTYDLLKDIHNNIVYEASNSLHNIYYSNFTEYNNRVHIYDVQTTLYEGYTEEMVSHAIDASIIESTFLTVIEKNQRNYLAESVHPVGISKFSKILTYPDWRATQMYVFEGSEQLLFANLKNAAAVNLAYKYRFKEETEMEQALNPGPRDPKEWPVCYVKYPCFVVDRKVGKKPEGENIIIERNKIQASALNNPFVFPFEHSYAVGSESNKIIALNSAAIEMSDAKFGEFPLYAFTEEGVFALQSGSGEVLYSAVIPLNYDKIINPHTLAVNHNVLYITSRGVHAMSSNKGNLISQPLNDLHDSPPLNYLKDAQLCYQHPFNEVIIWNPNLGDWAYVYSLDGGYWSTRDFKGDKLNTDEFVVQHTSGSYQILDLNSEVARSTPTEIKLTTRPIKFGSMEFKRLETLITRLTADIAVDMHIELEASQDRLIWLPLRGGDFKVLRDLTLRRVPFSFRYLRLSISADVTSNLEISGIDAEYYNRFVHKLR